MTCSGSEHDEERTLDAVPLELLPLHQGLEEDGSSWRATLPQADALLRRVVAPPPHPARLAPTGLHSAPHRRHHHKHTRH